MYDSMSFFYEMWKSLENITLLLFTEDFLFFSSDFNYYFFCFLFTLETKRYAISVYHYYFVQKMNLIVLFRFLPADMQSTFQSKYSRCISTHNRCVAFVTTSGCCNGDSANICKSETVRFYLDSAATEHMVSSRKFFEQKKTLTVPIKIGVVKHGVNLLALRLLRNSRVYRRIPWKNISAV